MDIYIARQPIFDRKLNIFGYELLYRRSMNNYYEGTDDNQSTAEVINNAFLTMDINVLTGKTKAFINFSEDMLHNEIPLLLPNKAIVVEILERVNVTEELIRICKKLKRNGYILALDDFVFHENYLSLVEIVDIIKFEFLPETLKIQRQLIKQYKHKIKFLAEKIETKEEYQLALEMGYDYFQGYFFSKPAMIKGKEVVGLNVNLLRILNELNIEEPDISKISEILKQDLGISYKLLKLANSTHYITRNQITSCKDALVRLGLIETKKWIYLIMLKEIESIENKELINNSLIRGKFMELLAYEIDMEDKHTELFMTGLFSSIDILLNRDMEEILNELPLTNDVKEALLGIDNKTRKSLDLVLNYELSYWDKFEDNDLIKLISPDQFIDLYIQSLNWVMELDYY